MKVLGIETSGNVGGFAVAEEGRVIAEVAAEIRGHHLEKSGEMIERVLGEAGTELAGLAGVAVSLGPGSFTGLRVGLALAKGLCFGTGLAIAGVPTLDCLAEAVASTEGFVIPVKDARRGEVYFSIYEARAGTLARLSAYRALTPHLLVDKLKGDSALFREERPLVLVGDGLARYGEVFRSGLGGRADFAGEDFWEARPAIVAMKGAGLLREGHAADLDALEPIYVRASEAERQAAGRIDRGTDRNKKNEGR